MSVTATSSGTASASSIQYAGATRGQSNSTQSLSMNADTFMQLFTTQLANQNPMDPMDSASFLNQFSQITQVQSMSELQKTLSSFGKTMTSMFTANQFGQATSLIGHTVQYADSKGNVLNGKVDSVQVDTTGTPQLLINNTVIGLDAVKKVS